MKKRIILDIEEKTHQKLKTYSIKDDRTLNSTIKRALSIGIDILNNEQKEKSQIQKNKEDYNSSEMEMSF